MAYPMFAGRVPQDEYSLDVDYDGNSATITVDTSGGDYYYLPPTTLGSPRTAAQLPTGSIWKLFLEALNADASGGGNVWRVQFDADRSKGYLATLTYTSGTTDPAIELKPSTTAGTVLPLTWFGWPQADQAGSFNTGIATEQHPQYTFFPWSHLNDRGRQPLRQQVFSSGATADGSVHTIRHDSGTLRYWRLVDVDGSVDAGIDGGRLDGHFLAEYATFATQAGVSASDPYVTLDATDGWWHRTVGGEPWYLVRDMHAPDGTTEGPLVFVYDEEAPVDMTGWATLGPPNVVRTRAGRRILSFCFRDYIAPS